MGSEKPPFDVLIMQAPDRFSRRDGDESFAELKAISKPGVQVWFYSDGTCFRYGTFESNVTGLLKAEFAAEKRRDSARKTTEALHQKARRTERSRGGALGDLRHPYCLQQRKLIRSLPS